VHGVEQTLFADLNATQERFAEVAVSVNDKFAADHVEWLLLGLRDDGCLVLCFAATISLTPRVCQARAKVAGLTHMICSGRADAVSKG
jgi:hypothetical protein